MCIVRVCYLREYKTIYDIKIQIAIVISNKLYLIKLIIQLLQGCQSQSVTNFILKQYQFCNHAFTNMDNI